MCAAVRCPVLVGRDREMVALRCGLADAHDGRGTGVAVLGAPGMGKTRLLRELAGDARAARIPMLVGRAVEAGASTAFRPLTEALLAGVRHNETAVGEVRELAPFRPALGRLLPSWRVAGVGVDESPVVLAEGVLRLLRLLAGGSGLVLAVEDLHWADPETLAVVEYLVDNLAEEPVLLVWTARDDPGPVAPLARALAARGGTLLALAPLDDADIAAMSTACLGHEPAAELLAVLRRRAAGTPLLVEQLLATGGADAATLVPATVHERVARRSATLSGPARACVRYAAVLGPVLDWTVLPSLLDAEPEEVLTALGEAADARLLDPSPAGFSFPHELIRDAVLARLLPPERAATAARALEVVLRAHPDLEPPWDEVAAGVAVLAGDSIRAARILLAAGRRDLDRGALATAEATLDRAAELATSDAQLATEIDDSLAEVLALAGKTDAAAATSTRLIGRLDERTDRDRLALAHLRVARVHATAGDWAAAGTEIDQARRWAGLSLAAQVEAAAAQVAVGRGRMDEARERAATALQAADEHGDSDTACEALEVLGRLARLTDLGAAEELFERARVRASHAGSAVREARALHELSSIDALDSLRFDRLEAARQRALDIGALGIAAVVDLNIAATALIRWDTEAMRPLAWRGVAGARRLKLATLPKALVLAGLADAATGQADGGEPAFAEALRRAPQDVQLTSDVWGARAHRFLLANDHDRAFAALERAVAVELNEVIVSPHVGLWLLMSTTATGTVPLILDGVTVSRWNRAYLRLAEAVALGRAGRDMAAAAAFAEGDATMSMPVDVRWHRRHARRIVAEAALADGWGDPVGWLTEDLAFFETLAQGRLASACRGLLRRAGSPVPRRGRHGATLPERLRRIGVTAREHEVLQLVGQGLDNRGVARRLVISPRTVEKHVERLLAKSGLTKRTELVAFAARVHADRDPDEPGR